MAIFGVTVSIVIVALGGGFSGSGISLFNPPNASNLWTVGQNIQSGTIMNYSLTRIGSHISPWSSLGEHSSLIDSLVSIQFNQDEGIGGSSNDNDNNDNNWKTVIHVVNGTTTTTAPAIASSKEQTVYLSKQQLTNEGSVSQDFIPYYEPIESSILEVRDIAQGPNYLVIGAQWNSITGGITTIPVKITGQEKIETNAGTFNTYVLSYIMGSKTSRIWIAHDVPLPIKAEVYNAQGQLQYKYTLLFYK
jgi:hypothetical protein